MIPSTTNKLLGREDWKKVYQSFKNADFKSYDFETLRRTMIKYLQENFPESFNDFIDSSEYIALIDIIAYLGQNLSFRVDLNARENFLETAQRRDSILRLAQLVSYNPRRNVPASGLLKVTSVSTTDNVYDSDGQNLSNTTIGWNDITNPNWYHQFITIMNSAMTASFGIPSGRNVVDGILTEQYRINSSNIDVPIFTYSRTINGTAMNFEIVPSTFSDKDSIYEDSPSPGNYFSLVYRNDNQGSGSPNSGFFTLFKQGTLSVANFSLDTPVPNEIVGVNTPDINNSDVWLWQLDNEGNFSTLWTQVPSLIGNNVIYNSLNKSIRTIYGVTSRDEDQIDLNFADGVFGDLPKGQFRIFYRQSNGQTYIIKPEQMSGIVISIPYLNSIGQSHVLNLTLSLQYTVSNAAGPESNASIQLRAPQTYYTQNRMITGEDYNILPLNAGPDILKIKSINRLSSGISRYFELSDSTGRYSRINIFANDGILYKETSTETYEFEFQNRNQVLGFLKNKVSSIVSSPQLRNFYFNNFPVFDLSSQNLRWNVVNSFPRESRGYFSNSFGRFSVGSSAEGNLQYVVPGSLVKFTAPAGQYFDEKNNLQNIETEDSYRFDLVYFVNKSKGTYNYREYYVKTLDILPLYTGNSSYSVSSGYRFALYRDPDYEGLKYWVDYALENSKTIGNIDFRTVFFNSTKGLDTQRMLTSLKNYLGVKQINQSYIPISGELEIPLGGKTYIWVSVKKIIGNGSEILEDGTGPVILSSKIPENSIVSQVIPKFPYILSFGIENEIANIMTTQKNFGLTIDNITRSWDIIENSNLNLKESFNLLGQNDRQDLNLDSSWLIAFVWTGQKYKILNRKTEYYFESEKETTFYFDETYINYDFITNSVVKNRIDVLSINPDAFEVSFLSKDFSFQIDSNVIETDGYVNPRKIKVSPFDYSNNLGNIVDPLAFDNVVGNNYVVFKKDSSGERYYLSTISEVLPNESQFKSYKFNVEGTGKQVNDGDLFYFSEQDFVKSYSTSSNSLIYKEDYFGRRGRSGLKFHYVHNSSETKRFDPAKMNIIDIYILTSSYDTEFRSYISGNISSPPTVPTSLSLETNYGSSLENVKAISDELIFHHVKYKILFGSKSDINLRAKFKAVKNSSKTISDNDLKTRILSAINQFFSLENWDFGQSFYFSELSTYVMNVLSPDITNFIILPLGNSNFGSYYEISSLSNEIFISGAETTDIEIIDAVTASQLKTSSIITSSGT